MAIEFIPDEASPEGFVPKMTPRIVRLAPTQADLARMAQEAEPTRLYVLGDDVPAELRGRISPELPSQSLLTPNEMVDGITAILAVREQANRQRVEADLKEAPHQRLMRELNEIYAERQAKVAPTQEVESDDGEREEPARSETEEPAKRVRVGAKAPARSAK